MKTGPVIKGLSTVITKIVNSSEVQAATRALSSISVGPSNQIKTSDATALLQYASSQKLIQQKQQEMQALKEREAELTTNEQKRLELLKQQTEQLRQQAREAEKELQRREYSQEQINRATQSLDDEAVTNLARRQERRNARSAYVTDAVTNSITAGLSAALIAGFAGADFSTIIETAGITALSAAIPNVIGAIIPKLINAVLPKLLGGIVGPVGLTAAVLTGIVFKFANDWKKANETARTAELNRLKNVKEINDNLAKQQINSLQEASEAKKNREKLEETIATYNELSKKSFLTSNEQDTLTSAINTINDDFSNIVLSYDENTQALRISTQAIENLTEEYQKQEQEATQEATLSQVQAVNNLNAGQETLRNIASDAINVAENLRRHRNVDIDSAGDFVYDRNIRFNRSIAAFSDDRYTFDYLRKTLKEGFSENSELFKELDLSYSDLNSVEDFKKYLDESNRTLQEFYQKLGDASDRLADDFSSQALETAKEGLENYYSFKEIDGEQISEELAHALASSVTEADLNTTTKKAFNEAIGSSSKDFIRDYLQDYQEGYAVDSKIQDALGAIKVGNTNADELIKKRMDEWKENNQELMSGFDGNLAEWTKLPDEFRRFLEDNYSYNADNWEDVRWKAKESKDLVSSYFYNLILKQQEAFGALTDEQLEAEKEQLLELNQLLQEAGTLTKEEYVKQFEEIVNKMTDPDAIKKVLGSQGFILDKQRHIIEDVNNKVSDSVYNKYIELIDAFNEQGVKNYENLTRDVQQRILDITSAANLSSVSSGSLMQDLTDFYNTLKPETQQVLSNMDLLNKSYGEVITNSDEYVKAFVETGEYSLEQANQILMKYVDLLSEYVSKPVTGEAGVEVFRDQLQGQFETTADKLSVLKSAYQEYLKDAEIGEENLAQLREAGYEKFITYTSKGIGLDAKAVEREITQTYHVPSQILDQQIKVNEDKLTEALSYMNKTFTISDGFGGTLKRSINELILEAKRNANSYIIQQLDPVTQNFVKAVAEEYDNIAELVTALQAGTAGLKGLRVPTKIEEMKRLVSAIKDGEEAVSSAKDDVAAANDELEDLNKQLTEDTKALQEAEEALQEAIHGSENFQSSLDGLVNYTEKIERLDKAIEKTKESLENVANIDEAKGLLGQLNEQYNDKAVAIGAENIAIDKAIANLRNTLTQNYGAYISFDEEGNPLIDFAYTAMDANDELRKAFEEEYNLYNEYRDKKEENLDKLESIEKEREEQRQEYLKNYVEIQKDVVSILQDQAKEEIEATKNKYSALEEADNDYLDALEDAIDKQRKLRDQQNKYEDLATKEKKLSLLQRDTSGINQKEVLTLEQEIQDDRQDLLDTEVDNLIDSMKELYEKQKEARDAEIEYMEEVTENAQMFADWASNIMSTWQSVEDMQAWYLENDPNAQDMTVEQTEVYLNELGEKYSDYAKYIAEQATNFTIEQEQLNAAINQMYENTSNNVENLGTVTQQLAQETADELIQQATETRDDARDKLQETQNQIAETQNQLAEAQQALVDAENNAISLHEEAMQQLVMYSQDGMYQVSAYAIKLISELTQQDLTNQATTMQWGRENNWVNSNNETTYGFKKTLQDAGVSYANQLTTYTAGKDMYKVYVDLPNGSSQMIQTFNNKSLAEEFIQKNNNKYQTAGGLHLGTMVGYNNQTPGSIGHGIEFADGTKTNYATKEIAQRALEGMKRSKNPSVVKKAQGAKIYKTGGLVDYTGPAWVDGTKYKPEAFLNAEDTKRIGEAARILSDIPILNSTSSAQGAISTNIGDTSFNIHINVESISSDYDVDRMAERLKQEIINVSKPIGTSVILKR